MIKKNMKKGRKNLLDKRSVMFGVVLAFALILISGFISNGLIVSSQEDSNSTVTDTTVSKTTEDAVKEIVQKQREIQEDKIESVSKVDLNKLPEEIKIDKIEENNLAVYEVNYNNDVNEQKKVFVLTYTADTVDEVKDVVYNNVNYLTFTDHTSSGIGRYLLIDGVRSSEELGYVMLDKGSITGLSTNLEIVNSSSGAIEIIVYRNGNEVGLKNIIDASQVGVAKDFDLQSYGIVNFDAGDVISVKTIQVGDNSAVWKNVVTSVKITTEVKK